MKFEDFLKFDKMITPTIITIVYAVQVIVAIVAGLGMIFRGMDTPWGGGQLIFIGLLLIVVGPISARVFCEITIVLFKINASLRNIDENLKPAKQDN